MVATTVVSLLLGIVVYRKIDDNNYQLNKQKQEQFFLNEEIKCLQIQADSVSKELERLRDTHPYSSPK
jgi:cytochrome c-type biogenesis protein CcmH/NrfF